MPIRKLTVAAAGGTWVVRAGGAVIGESARAVELSRDGVSPTIFFPREDLGMAFLEASPETRAGGELGPARYFGSSPRAACSTTPPGPMSPPRPRPSGSPG